MEFKQKVPSTKTVKVITKFNVGDLCKRADDTYIVVRPILGIRIWWTTVEYLLDSSNGKFRVLEESLEPVN